ncbi:unnamed protein product [Zymoseptoria tritici ST99CH_3D7]|uniref:Uncharacterized protein n=1 Tax=Zymoseptoria tritici (strain ST99CH_3D7) TaxID=1276538 RepID=A0A1X7RNJ2_ZYMT9|nr:unnamed protein product [Zymoseptoria tritici ST99CH_3D7]
MLLLLVRCLFRANLLAGRACSARRLRSLAENFLRTTNCDAPFTWTRAIALAVTSLAFGAAAWTTAT